ncbi:hypothetical protein ACLS0R_14605 [Comamonas jiangduensis]|uniref:hypothetical protein n=1 Tax=Comamonas jiangduensis TaxID=1194168 RepID=UPI003BF827C4
MTHTSTEQPEAEKLARIYEGGCDIDKRVAAELRRLHARVQELEASQPLSEPITHAAHRPTWDGQTFSMTQIKPMHDIKIEQLHAHWEQHKEFGDVPFTAGVRYAERAHGITQEKQG